MTCPECNGQTKVVDSREPDAQKVRRRRECLVCGYRFNTLEVVLPEADRCNALDMRDGDNFKMLGRITPTKFNK